MLTIHRGGSAGTGEAVDLGSLTLPGPGGWVDLVSPTAEEQAAVEAATGFKVPNRAQLDEVEVSSRLRRDGAVLYLALPVVFRGEGNVPRITPVGFILSADHFVTIRYEALKAFQTCQEQVEGDDVPHPCTASTFVVLLEAIVDRLADILEEASTDLDRLADDVLGCNIEENAKSRPKAQDQNLRRTLRVLGRSRQLVSKVRATLLGIGRIVPYVQGEGEEWLPKEASHRLDTVRHDVESLDEYEVHLSDKVQFLLDADLGLINIEQNDRFRVLTVVSIIGIPPTFVASMYGMNFKRMPELEWAYGYPYGLALIAISALIPILWFRRRGWI